MSRVLHRAEVVKYLNCTCLLNYPSTKTAGGVDRLVDARRHDTDCNLH